MTRGRGVRLAGCVAAVLLLTGCARPDDGPDGGPDGGLDAAEKRRRIGEMYAGYQAEFPDVPVVSVEELVAALEGEAPPLLVDVRQQEERAVSTLPGAVSQGELESMAGDLEGRRIVTYCTIGYRSGLYAAELRRRGLDAYNLEGSILAWTHAGLPLEHDGEETRRVHVFGPRWNLAADGYEAVW